MLTLYGCKQIRTLPILLTKMLIMLNVNKNLQPSLLICYL